MSHFMALAVEVRLMIYNYCLVVEKVFPYLKAQKKRDTAEKTDLLEYPKPNTYQAGVHGRNKVVLRLPKDSTTPNMSLLAVNKIIRTEARPIVYQQNTFVLPNAFYAAKFFKKALPSPAEKLWLKSVELELCDEDMSVSTKNKFVNDMMLDIRQAMFCSYRHNEDHVRSSVSDRTNVQNNNWKNHLGHVI